MAQKKVKNTRRVKNVDIYSLVATEIWAHLNNNKKLTRDAGQFKLIEEISDIIRLKIDAERAASKIKAVDYTKDSLKHDLIREVQGGNAASAKLLADLEGWRTKGTDYLIVSVNYRDIEGIDEQSLVDMADGIDRVGDYLVDNQEGIE